MTFKRISREDGSIGVPLMVILFLVVLLGWVMIGASSTHYLQAARRSWGVNATELAQAGVEEAAARIQQAGTTPLPPSGPVHKTEATGEIDFTITPTDRGTYTVKSTGTSHGETRVATAEVAPPVDRFAFLANGNLNLTTSGVLDLATVMIVDGDINANGSASLGVFTAIGSRTLLVKGDVNAANNATVNANGGLSLSLAEIQGNVAAGQDVTLGCNFALVTVKGSAIYGNTYQTVPIACVNPVPDGGVIKGGVEQLPYVNMESAFYDALVADLEAKGKLQTLTPDNACGKISQNTRVTGDLVCTDIEVAEGSVVVVDGSLQANVARVQGLLYVRGGSQADPRGAAVIEHLQLLKIIAPIYPMAGGGTLVATGNIQVNDGGLIALLSGEIAPQTVMQVMAISTGPDDTQNDLNLVFGDLIGALKGSKAPPLFLYTSKGGNINLSDGAILTALGFDELPLIAVAGGNLTFESGKVAGLISTFTIRADENIWTQVPPFLRDMGRARVLHLDWD